MEIYIYWKENLWYLEIYIKICYQFLNLYYKIIFFSKPIIHTVPNQTSISKNSIQHQNKSIEHYPRSIHSLYGTLLNLFLHFALVVSKRGIERGAWCVPVTESKRNKRTKNKKRRGTGGESSLSWRNIRQVFDCIVFCTPGNSDVPGRPRESA